MWVVSANAVLGAAVAAALLVLGWPTVRVMTEGHLAIAVREHQQPGRVILVADDLGRLPDPHPALVGRIRPIVVAVGTKAALPALADAITRLHVVSAVDGDQPFPDLIHALDGMLRGAAPTTDPSDFASTLRIRELEARRFAELSLREQEVLGALLIGQTATEIAASLHLSVSTIRTHIRAILTTLNVCSQLAAVALAHRSCREKVVADWIRRIHQF